jgi:hypothetical protein
MDSDFKVIENNTTATIQISLHCLQAHPHGQTTRTSSSDDNNNSLAKGNARQQATTLHNNNGSNGDSSLKHYCYHDRDEYHHAALLQCWQHSELTLCSFQHML